MNQKDQIVIYQSKDGQTSIEVNLKEETIWLSQKQMAELFDKDRSTITEHILNIYRTEELEKKSTCGKFPQVQIEGNRKVNRQIEMYNLDMIISVGYRVNSKRGTQFRIWATSILKKHLTEGYTVNQKRLQELQQTIKLLKEVIDTKEITKDEAQGLLKVITDYNYALETLDRFDHETLKVEKTSKKELFKLDYKLAREAINKLGDKLGSSELFGNEKDYSFKSSLNAIYQSFDGQDLYPSAEEKAAHLLYFVVKNHSFSDGNKRIAAFLFVWFLERNKILYNLDGSKRIANNALVALTLMIAKSSPHEKKMMTNLVVSLINRNN